jgi:arginine repressor
MKATYHKYILDFKDLQELLGVMTTKETWFIILEENEKKE